MNYQPDYQHIIDSLRGSWGPKLWPGKKYGSPAVSLLPNVAAELEATGYCPSTAADHANVSLEVMVAVMEDGEDLSTSEFIGLARLFNASIDYLASPELTIVEPETEESKATIQQLSDLLAEAGEQEFYGKNKAREVLSDLQSGKPITYARCHEAIGNVKLHISFLVKPKKRTTRFQ